MKITRKLITENKIIMTMSLYPGKTREEVAQILCTGFEKRMRPVVIVVLLIFVVTGIITLTTGNDVSANLVQRNEMGEAAKSIHIAIGNEESAKDYTFQLNPISMTDEAVDILHERICDDLVSILLGENESVLEVRTDLVFPEFLSDYGVSISWVTDRPHIINSRGEVDNYEMLEACSVEIIAKMYYGDVSRYFYQTVVVQPYEYSEEEMAFRQVLSQIKQKEAEERDSEMFEVPDNVDGIRVSVTQERRVPLLAVALAGGILVVVYAYNNYFSSLSERRKKRISEAEDQYKSFVSRIYLLLSTGLSLRLCVRRIADEYDVAGKKGLLAESLKVMARELETGGNEIESYQMFGTRMESVKFQRLASIFVQQTTKGVRNMGETLENEVREAYQADIASVKSKGEEVSTKLLLPMMGMMLIIFAVLMMPALSNL